MLLLMRRCSQSRQLPHAAFERDFSVLPVDANCLEPQKEKEKGNKGSVQPLLEKMTGFTR